MIAWQIDASHDWDEVHNLMRIMGSSDGCSTILFKGKAVGSSFSLLLSYGGFRPREKCALLESSGDLTNPSDLDLMKKMPLGGLSSRHRVMLRNDSSIALRVSNGLLHDQLVFFVDLDLFSS